MVRVLEDLWQVVERPRVVTAARAVVDPILGGVTDGYPHRRLDSGYCTSCGALPGEEHSRCEPSRAPDAPIYYRLLAIPVEEREVRHSLLMAGYGPKTIEAGVRFWRWHRERKTE